MTTPPSVRTLRPWLTFPDTALARRPEGLAPDNLLKSAVRDQDIVLTVRYPLDYPQEYDRSDTLQLLIGDEPVDEPVELRDYVPGDDVPIVLRARDRPLSVVQDHLPVSINYRVAYESGAGSFEKGPDGQGFVTDIVAPGRQSLSPAIFPDDVVVGGITAETLRYDDGDAYVPCTIKAYLDQSIGDRVTGYVDGEYHTPPIEISAADIGADSELRFRADLLASIDDGQAHAFQYRIEDRAGNVSILSEAIRLVVSIAPRLAPARIPDADDGLLTNDDADRPHGVRILIPGNAFFRSGDVVALTWNAHDYGPFVLTAEQATADPVLDVGAPYPDVYGDWQAVAQASDTNVDAEVAYTVSRNGTVVGAPTVATPATVNLFTPGGEDPQPELPWHGNLRPPIVPAVDGGPPNEVPADQAGEDATVTLPAFTALDPNVPAFIAGDRLQLFWDDAPVDNPFVVVDAGIAVQRTVPGTLVRPGVARMHYTARRALATTPFENISRSPEQDVTVQDPVELPGGGAELAPAEWMEGPAAPGRPDQIDYDKAVSGGGTPVRMPGYVNMAVGDRIHGRFRGFATTTPGREPIDEADVTFDKEVGDDDVLAGHVQWIVPTVTLLLIEFGSATFDYRVSNRAGMASAAQAWIYVATRH